MPFKDPAKKKAWSKRWKKQGREIGYNTWLYQRRKARFDDAAEFRKVLEYIVADDESDVAVFQALANDALRASDRRLRKVGPSPRANGIATTLPEQEATGDTLAQALAKLGLT